jgi:hypothetical protein
MKPVEKWKFSTRGMCRKDEASQREPKTCRKEEASQSETTTDINKGEAKLGAACGIEDP